MMKIGVSTHSWLPVGGGRFVMAKALQSFMGAGYDAFITSTFTFDAKQFLELYGIDLGRVKCYSLSMPMPKLFGVYQRLISSLPLRRAIEIERPDIIFTDNEFHKPILKMKSRYGFKVAEYIHFPFKFIQLLYSCRDMSENLPSDVRDALEVYARDAEFYHKKYEKGLWRLYFGVWLRFYRTVAIDNPFCMDDCVFVNSKYIARLVELLWHEKPMVLYPPVNVGDLLQQADRRFDERDEAVVMLARLTPEKMFETAIDAVALSKSKPRLRIIGGAIATSYPYLDKLRHMCEGKKVNVEFCINLPRSEVVKLLAKSKVFVHACRGEHFGISVVEGMAAGLPVIVHRSGGPYEDITDRGYFGEHFETPEELADKIDEFMSDATVWNI
jgi:glycosyltransferase involved in cell wall biosynthesis